MEAYSFSSLSDILEQPPSHNLKFMESLSSQYPISKHQLPHDQNLPYVTEMFGELYFKESLSTSPTQDFLSTNITNFGKHEVMENWCVYGKNSRGRNERLFPPPISCLKRAKNIGDPMAYFRFDESYSTFVPEERRIHGHGLLCASRNSGRLKLSFHHQEPEEEEEEQEENDGKETSDEEWIVVDFGDLCA